MADPTETTRTAGAPATIEESELLGAVRSLSAQVGGLQSELQALRSETRPLPPGQAEVPGWEVDAPARRDGTVWMRSVASPALRRPAIPQLAIEIAFLAAVATLAAVARLDTPVIVAVMIGAWALVALAEWAAQRAVRLRNEVAFGHYAGPGGETTWFSPRREPALEDVGADGQAEAKLPPAASD